MATKHIKGSWSTGWLSVLNVDLSTGEVKAGVNNDDKKTSQKLSEIFEIFLKKKVFSEEPTGRKGMMELRGAQNISSPPSSPSFMFFYNWKKGYT